MKKSVIEYLENTVKVFPDKTAVKDSDGTISFDELWRNGQMIAATKDLYELKNQPIGVYIQKGCQAVEAFVGIIMSCNFYVPLDTKSPEMRVTSILDVLQAEIVVTNRKYVDKLCGFYKGHVLVIEDVFEKTQCPDPLLIEEKLSHQIDTDPVYSIFTSGSTGTPKGVVISHRNVIDYIDWFTDTFKINSDAIIGNQVPFYFDISTTDIYLMCAKGATLNIIPESCFMFPAKLIEYLNNNRISFVFWVPFVLMSVSNVDALNAKKPIYLKDVFFAGEVMPNRHLNYWRKHLPQCRYVNLYGPTEITVIATYYEVNRPFSDDEPLPIGYPCRNCDVMILSDRKSLVERGEKGELCVRGTSLALGYYNNEEKTQAAFIQNPLQSHYPEVIYCTGDAVYENERGEIMYVGRIDSQIKHNGYRIELGEIENAVLGSGLVDNCCVIYDYDGKRICLYYQAKEAVDMGEFRRKLIDRIPKYMLPTEFYREDRIKQNANGKIDRAYYNNKTIKNK